LSEGTEKQFGNIAIEKITSRIIGGK